jgi:hypothetical protein
MTALYGTFVRLQTMADGGVRLVLDLGCSLADIAALNLMPGAAFGLARITGESTILPIAVEPEEKNIFRPLCRLACIFCQDPLFQEWADVLDEEGAKEFILNICNVISRKHIDGSPDASGAFLLHVRKPFIEWRDKQ